MSINSNASENKTNNKNSQGPLDRTSYKTLSPHYRNQRNKSNSYSPGNYDRNYQSYSSYSRNNKSDWYRSSHRKKYNNYKKEKYYTDYHRDPYKYEHKKKYNYNHRNAPLTNTYTSPQIVNQGNQNIWTSFCSNPSFSSSNNNSGVSYELSTSDPNTEGYFGTNYYIDFEPSQDEIIHKEIHQQNNENLSEINEVNIDESLVVGTEQEITKDKNDKNTPRISLVPLPLLLKEEYLSDHQQQNYDNSEFENYISRSKQSKETTNLRTSNTDPDRISRNLLNRVVKMGKTDIKNVINNPTTKFDVALKIQARKRLREKIRKQLKNMNLTTSTSSDGEHDKINDNFFEPDESIDPGQIPEAILNEISKSLGIELLTEAGLHDENYLAEIDATTLLSAEGLVTTTSTEITTKQQDSDVIQDKEGGLNNNKQTDLMTRIKNFEAIKLTTDKTIKKVSKDKNNKKSTLNETTKDKSTESKKIINENSNLSSSESSSDSSSDSESSSSSSDSHSSSDSSTSNKSTNISATVNKAKKYKILEGNVITHFNTLTLPMMPVRERQRYEKRTFKNNIDNLLYILDYCLKKAESDSITFTSHRKRILKNNLKSRDNEEVLQFLTQKIKEMFEENRSKKTNTNLKSKLIDKKQQNVTKLEKKSKEKSTTSSTSSKNISNVSTKRSQNTPNSKSTPVKRKYSRKCSKSVIEKDTNSSPIKSTIPTVNSSNDQTSFVDCDKSHSPNKILQQIESNPSEDKSKNDSILIQQNNINSNKETFNNHKRINNCEEILPTVETTKVVESTKNSNADNEYEKGHNGVIQSNLNEDVCVDNGEKTLTATENQHKENREEIIRNDVNSTTLESSYTDDGGKGNQLNDKVNETEADKMHLDTKMKKSDENNLENELNNSQKIQRSWKSPGEKKCLQQLNSPSTQKQQSTSMESAVNFILNDTNRINSLKFNSNFDSFNYNSNIFDFGNQSESLRILSSDQQNKTSDVIFGNLKEIDLKLIELQRRSMYIDEMVLKLQNDKLQLELTAGKLKNEKFLLINAILSENNSCINTDQLKSVLTIKDEQIKSNSKSNATDLMTNMLSAEEQKQRQRRRTISTKRLSSSSIDREDSKRYCKQSHRNSKNLNEDNSDVESIKINQTENILQNKEKSLSENQLIKNKSNIIFKTKSEYEISENIQSSENFLTKNKNTKLKNNKNSTDSTIIEILSDESNEDTESILNRQIKNTPNNYEKFEIINGFYENSKNPITQIRIIENFVIAASQDGIIYKYCSKTKKILSKFSKHTESITEIFINNNNFVYSISLDGHFKMTSLENFGLEIQSKNLKEPLQCFDLQWNIAFIGSRWGNIFTYNLQDNKLSDTLLCSLGSAITALKAIKEGARKILIVSSKGNQINFRDATSGFLLRTINTPDSLVICNILLDGDLLYCGSNKNEIHTFNFTTGTKLDKFICGNGAVSIKLYKRKLIFVGCYDGFVYVLDKITGSQIGRFPGAGKMILALDIIGDKIITSSKDNLMEIRDIPTYILALLRN